MDGGADGSTGSHTNQNKVSVTAEGFLHWENYQDITHEITWWYQNNVPNAKIPCHYIGEKGGADGLIFRL